MIDRRLPRPVRPRPRGEHIAVALLAPATIGPADLLAQARQADLVLAAIAAAAEGRDLPGDLSPQIQEDIRRRIVASDGILGPARLTAFAPLLPVHWEREIPFGEAAPSPNGDAAHLRAALLGTVTVRYDATPGRSARTARRPLAREVLTVGLARRDGRWVVTRVDVPANVGTLVR